MFQSVHLNSVRSNGDNQNNSMILSNSSKIDINHVSFHIENSVPSTPSQIEINVNNNIKDDNFISTTMDPNSTIQINDNDNDNHSVTSFNSTSSKSSTKSLNKNKRKSKISPKHDKDSVVDSLSTPLPATSILHQNVLKILKESSFLKPIKVDVKNESYWYTMRKALRPKRHFQYFNIN